MSEDRHKVVVVEDEKFIRIGLEEVLGTAGFEVVSTGDGATALDLIHREKPAVVLLDIMLPGMSGFDICREMRKRKNMTPVLMLTAKGQEVDKVLGLDLGADDYVTKPFQMMELIARVKALIRRSHLPGSGDEDDGQTFAIGQSTISKTTYSITGNGEELDLTPREMDLLQAFAKNRGTVLSRERLLNEVWGVNYFGTTRTLDQTVAQVRKKLRLTGSDPEIIDTVHGVGYRLVEGQ